MLYNFYKSKHMSKLKFSREDINTLKIMLYNYLQKFWWYKFIIYNYMTYYNIKKYQLNLYKLSTNYYFITELSL